MQKEICIGAIKVCVRAIKVCVRVIKVCFRAIMIMNLGSKVIYNRQQRQFTRNKGMNQCIVGIKSFTYH